MGVPPEQKLRFKLLLCIYGYIAEIFDGTGMKDPEVGKFRIFVLKFWSIQTKSQLWFIVEG